jgi:heptosyltransferase II
MINVEFPLALCAIKKILIVGPAWIGDMMMAQSLYKLLKLRNPQVHISVLSLAWTRPLLALMPEVDHVIDMPLGHGALDIKARYSLGKKLRTEKFEQAIILPNSFKSALIPYFAKIPLRTGWRGEMRFGLVNDRRVLDKKKYPLMVQRYDALALPAAAPALEKFPYPQLTIDNKKSLQIAEQFSLSLTRPVMVVCPGAEYGPAKRWPEHYFAQVAEEKIRQGWQVWLMGSMNDRVVAEQMRELISINQQAYCSNLAGNTQLLEAITLINLADAVLTNDSGLMHVAAALKKPLVVLFGSTSPAHTPPLTDRVKLVTNAIECSPCFERICPKQHHKCLRELDPQKVLQALSDLLPNTLPIAEQVSQ